MGLDTAVFRPNPTTHTPVSPILSPANKTTVRPWTCISAWDSGGVVLLLTLCSAVHTSVRHIGRRSKLNAVISGTSTTLSRLFPARRTSETNVNLRVAKLCAFSLGHLVSASFQAWPFLGPRDMRTAIIVFGWCCSGRGLHGCHLFSYLVSMAFHALEDGIYLGQ